jgi:hypothetical protein
VRGIETGSVYGTKQLGAAGAGDLRQIAGLALKTAFGKPGKCRCLDPVGMQAMCFGRFDGTAGQAGRQPPKQVRVMNATATDENLVDFRRILQNCRRNRLRTQLRERRLNIACFRAMKSLISARRH